MGLSTLLHCNCVLKRLACCIFGSLLKTAPKTQLPIKINAKHIKNALKAYHSCVFGVTCPCFTDACQPESAKTHMCFDKL